MAELLTIGEILQLYGTTTDEIVERHLTAMVDDLRLLVICEQSRSVSDREIKAGVAAFISERC